MRGFIPIVMVLLLLSSCYNAEQSDFSRLQKFETTLIEQQDVRYDSIRAEDLLQAYRIFMSSHPKSEKKPEILFKYGEVSKAQGDYLTAADAFYQIHNTYPDLPIAPLALFQQADCFEALNQRLTAKNTYQEFIDRYPTHPYVDQAKGLIHILHLSNEELIHEFQN